MYLLIFVHGDTCFKESTHVRAHAHAHAWGGGEGGGGEGGGYQAIIFLFFWFTQLTCLMLMALVEKVIEKNADEWVSKVEREWKQRTEEGTKTKKETDSKEEPRGKILRQEINVFHMAWVQNLWRKWHEKYVYYIYISYS